VIPRLTSEIKFDADNVTYTETADIVRGERWGPREVDGHRIVGDIAHGLQAFVSILPTEEPLIRALTAWL
jgi:hypothetical protein